MNEKTGSQEQDQKNQANINNKLAYFNSNKIIHFSDLINLTHPVSVLETEKKVTEVVNPRNTEETQENETTTEIDFDLLDDIASLALN